MPGYTILVLDTNILLSSLPMVISLVESLYWTIVIPLPAIMELDRLALNANPLGNAAKEAIVFVVGHVLSFSFLLLLRLTQYSVGCQLGLYFPGTTGLPQVSYTGVGA